MTVCYRFVGTILDIFLEVNLIKRVIDYKYFFFRASTSSLLSYIQNNIIISPTVQYNIVFTRWRRHRRGSSVQGHHYKRGASLWGATTNRNSLYPILQVCL